MHFELVWLIALGCGLLIGLASVSDPRRRFLGPGDAGALYVQFDPSWRKVTWAEVDQSF